MGVSTGAEAAALGLTIVVHIIGAVVLVWAMLSGEEREDGQSWWRGWWPRDDDGGGPPPPGPEGPHGGREVELLDDAEPSAQRLREPRRIGDAHPRPARRPAHPPTRRPVRDPAER